MSSLTLWLWLCPSFALYKSQSRFHPLSSSLDIPFPRSKHAAPTVSHHLRIVNTDYTRHCDKKRHSSELAETLISQAVIQPETGLPS